MAKIKCSFCSETVEAPLWPEQKPSGWEVTKDGMIICPAHEGGFHGELTVPMPGGGTS